MSNDNQTNPDGQGKALNNLSAALRKEAFLAKLENDTFSFPETGEEVMWYEEYLDAHPELSAGSDQALKEMETMAILSWYELAVYLRKQLRNGKTEFRISTAGDRKFVIRPFGKDSQCLEIKV